MKTNKNNRPSKSDENSVFMKSAWLVTWDSLTDNRNMRFAIIGIFRSRTSRSFLRKFIKNHALLCRGSGFSALMNNLIGCRSAQIEIREGINSIAILGQEGIWARIVTSLEIETDWSNATETISWNDLGKEVQLDTGGTDWEVGERMCLTRSLEFVPIADAWKSKGFPMKC